MAVLRLCSGLWMGLLLLSGVVTVNTAGAEELFLADGKTFPGQLWQSAGGAARSIHRRAGEANAAFPRAAMKLAQVAVGPEGKVYFSSGLDPYVLHLQDGRHEILSFEFAGQIRDLACSGDEHTVYFSVVPTPQNGEPLVDGKIFRRDLWDGLPTLVATVHQSEIGGNWWGTFTIRDGIIHLATLENRSRLFKLTSAGPVPEFRANTFKIQGLSAAADGSFYFATGTDKVYRTVDFTSVEVALESDRPFTDVALKAPAGTPGP